MEKNPPTGSQFFGSEKRSELRDDMTFPNPADLSEFFSNHVAAPNDKKRLR